MPGTMPDVLSVATHPSLASGDAAVLTLQLSGRPSQHVIRHPGQLSLAIAPWVGAVSTSDTRLML